MYTLTIVDDEKRIVRGLTQAIKSSGLPFSEVYGFHSANEALEEMKRAPADILLSDIRMPETDGLALIAMVKKRHPACRVIFLTGYGQFEYAQQAVKLGAFDFLVKPITDEHLFECLERVILSLEEERKEQRLISSLKSRYEATVPVLRSAFLKQLTGGRLAELRTEEILEKSRSLNVPLDPAKEVTMILVRPENRQKTRSAAADAEIDGDLAEELEEAFSPGFRYAAFWDEHGFLVCLMQSAESSAPHNERKRLRLAADKLRDRLFLSLGMEVSAILSSSATDHATLSAVYRDAARLLKRHIRSVRGDILDVEKEREPVGREWAGLDLLGAIGSLDLLLESGNEPEYYRRLSAVFQAAGEAQGLPYRVIAEICQNISLSLIKALNKLILSESELAALEMDEWANVNRFSSIEEMSERFADASAKAFALIKRRRDENKDAISRLKWYISQHLDGDLSLTRLAEVSHMSSPYLSRVFKEQTGEGVIHYITRLRIERAIELMRDPTLKIADIAVRSGYDNIPYFTKVFKKIIGVTPQEFKKV